MDDRDRSSFSSDPGSAIEGFQQKIPLAKSMLDSAGERETALLAVTAKL
jgi:hypothetical protein